MAQPRHTLLGPVGRLGLPALLATVAMGVLVVAARSAARHSQSLPHTEAGGDSRGLMVLLLLVAAVAVLAF